MATQAIQKLAHAADSAKATLARFKERAKLNETRMLSAGEIVLGGAAGGLIDGKFDDGTGSGPKVAGVSAVGAGSALLLVLGLTDAFPGVSHLGYIGAGGLAYKLGTLAHEKIKAA
jgi:hypothetical protein